jgi:CRISPR-associated protein Csx17
MRREGKFRSPSPSPQQRDTIAKRAVAEAPAIYGRHPVQYDLELAGCTPEPLISYLKALGILRLVSEQKDECARGWWKNDVLWLRSTLDPDGLKNFLLREYNPTPLVGPWGARSGFYSGSSEKKARQALETLMSTTDT